MQPTGYSDPSLCRPFSLDRFCFIYQHDRNIIFYFVQQFAFFTDKSRVILQFYRPLALRTCQNFQQILIYHNPLPMVVFILLHCCNHG